MILIFSIVAIQAMLKLKKRFSKVIRIALIADCFILFVVDVHENVGRVFPNRVCR